MGEHGPWSSLPRDVSNSSSEDAVSTVSSSSRRLTESPGDCAGCDMTSIKSKIQSLSQLEANPVHYLISPSHDAPPASLLPLTALVEEVGKLLWVVPHGQWDVEEGM